MAGSGGDFAEVIVMRRVWLRAVIEVTSASLSLLLLSSGAAEWAPIR